MYTCPVTYFEQNLIFDDQKSCWGVFKLNGFNYDFLSEQGKETMLHRLSRFVANIIDEAKILMLPIIQDINGHCDRLIKRIDPKGILYPYSKNHIELTRQYLLQMAEGSGSANDYDFYFIVKLVTETSHDVLAKVKTALETIIKDPVNAINSVFGADKRDIMQSKINYYKKLADRVWENQNKRIAMQPTTPGETQRLLKRITYRGNEKNIQMNLTRGKVKQADGSYRQELSEWLPFAQRIPTRKGDTIVRPYLRDTVNLVNGTIDTRTPRRIAVKHDDGTTVYQTFLTLTHIPDVQEFPGSEWLYMMQQLNCQCEVCIHIKNIENRKALEETEKKTKEIASEYNNAADAGARIPEEVAIGFEQTEWLEAEIKDSRNPISNVCVSVAISSTDEEVMEAKANHVYQVYKDQGYRMERPASDQFNLFLQHIPGGGIYTKDFNMMLTPTTLAGGIFGATSQLGDDSGMFIGTTGLTKKPVWLDKGQACLMNKSPAAAIMGNLGFGKSLNANMLGFLNVLMGGRWLIIDPKGERGHWKTDLPIPDELITVVTLDGREENKGKLDPFLIYSDDFTEASSLALSSLAELLGLKTKDDEYTLLNENIDKMRGTKTPCMEQVVKNLQEVPKDDIFYDAAVRLARRILALKKGGLFQLMYGAGHEEAIKLDNIINIIQIQNLQIPSPETPRSDYDTAETFSSVLVRVVGNFAKRFALMKLPVFSTITMDESWMLRRTAEGQKLYEFLARTGRSLFTGCDFIGHSVLDISSEGVKNAITYAFFFHSDNTDECIRMLEFLDMDTSEENIQVIKNLGNAECLFRDAYGRVGKLKFDCVFEDLLKVFSTTPKTREQEAVAS